MKRLWVVGLLWLAGCGVDSDATVGGVPSDAELTESSDELASSRADVWWPLAQGNEWILQSPRGGTIRLAVSYSSGSIRYLEGMNGEGVWLGHASSAPNSLYVYNWDEGWGPLVRFGYAYTPWDVRYSDGPCDHFRARRSATGARVQAMAGAFTDVRKVEFEIRPDPTVLCRPPYVKELAFAPGVGPVALSSGTGETFLLASAKVGQRQYGGVSGISVSVSADRAEYTSRPNTIACVTAPCPSNEVTAVARLTLTVRNTSSSARTFQFRSGQRFDFLLSDDRGELRATWSESQLFTQASGSLTLSPGQSRSFTAEMPLKGRDGQQLEGIFTVRGVLTTADGNGPSATTTIRVTIQE